MPTREVPKLLAPMVALAAGNITGTGRLSSGFAHMSMCITPSLPSLKDDDVATATESIEAWEAIIERGRTTSTYKMALARAISDMVDKDVRHADTRQLAVLFFDIYMDRLRFEMPQLSDPNADTIVEKAIARFKSGTLSEEQAVMEIQQKGFRDVLDAFHKVGGGKSPIMFYTHGSTGITLTDAAFKALQSSEKDRLLRQIDSRWSSLEDSFARNRLGDSVSVWAATRGADYRKPWAWCNIHAPSGIAVNSGLGMRSLAQGVCRALGRDERLCLGLETPLTVWVPREPNPSPADITNLVEYRKASDAVSLSLGGYGSKPGRLGIEDTAWLMGEIRGACGTRSRPTLSWRRFVDGLANLFIWEASLTGSAMDKNREELARRAATGFLHHYPRLLPCDQPERVIPLSLVAAQLSWAGFTTETDLIRSPAVVVKVG